MVWLLALAHHLSPDLAKERATYSGEGVEGTHGKVNNPTGKSGDEVRTNE